MLLRLAFTAIGALPLCAQSFAIRDALVIDGTGAPPRVSTILVADGRIKATGPDVPIPAGATVFEAAGKTLTPGLFDLHTHVWANPAAGSETDWAKNLKSYLHAGITTVVDVGTYPEQFDPIRRLIAGGLPAPRLIMAARFSTPGGHGAEGGRGDFHTQLVQTPREARSALRRILVYKPDIIKIFTDGWRYGTDVDMTSMDQETLSTLVDESHKADLKVVTHTVTVEKAKAAGRAKADIINHGLGDAPADSELFEILKKSGSGYVQTLAVYEPRSATASAARLRRWKNLLHNGKALGDAGIPLGSGTDAGMTGTPHGLSSLHELELMVQAGLTPVEAIKAGTGTSAKLLGVDFERGTIAPGKLADLVLFDGSPATSIAEIRKVDRVWLGGKEVDRPALLAAIHAAGPTPIPPVKAQALLDDFESPKGRSRLDTLWLNNTDAGHDHSKMTYARTRRTAANHALTILAEMSGKDRPTASMLLPLSKGAVLPVDVRAFRGVEFECRGDGEHFLVVQTRAVRDRRFHNHNFMAEPAWKKVRIAFTAMRQPESKYPVAWTGTDLTALEFLTTRKPGEKAWLEIDNIRFYR